MIKPAKIVFLILICSFFEINALSQYYVKVKTDSIGFEIDSVILAVDSLPGLINWEISKDSLTWEPLNITNDTLSIRIDDEAYYRAEYLEGTCFPVSSDIIFAGFKSIHVTGNNVIIEPTGGVYFLPSGIKLIVPPGAVEENVTVSFDLLDSINADLKIPFDGDIGKVFCTGIYCEPSDIQFLKPIRVRVPSLNYQHTDIPFVYIYNNLSDTWSQYTGTLTCSENKQFIEYTTDELFSARIELIKDVFAFSKSSLKLKGEDIDCHELLVEIKSRAYDYAGQLASGECYVVDETISVEFTACPGSPVATAHIREIGEKCKPVITSSVDKECLTNGETTTLTINVSIGGLPLDSQQVYIELPNGLSTESTYLITDNSGNAKFNIKSNVDNLNIDEIIYNVHTQYYLEIIEASADGTTETNKKYQKTSEIPGTQKIGCNQIKYVDLFGGGNNQLKAGETDQISCECLDQDGNKIDCGDVVYSIVPGSEFPQAGAISVSSDGLVTANNPGVARIQAVASGIESRNNIHYSVAYEGDLVFNGVVDHNIYKNCGCADDYYISPDHEWKWYVVTYSVDLHFYFWLSSQLDDTPWGDLEGTNTYIYDIDADSYCKDTTIVETVNGHDGNQMYINGPFTNATTQQVISGNEFYLNYGYWDYLGWGSEQIIELSCEMNIASGEINVHVDYYWPEGCVRRVHPDDFVLK